MNTTINGKGVIKVSALIDKANQTLEIYTDTFMDGIADYRHKQVVNLKEELIRNALIDMGWTPPEGKA